MNLFRNFAKKILSIDDTKKPISQMEFLSTFLSKHRVVLTNDLEENLQILKKKHLVDSFVVTNKEGSVILSSEENGQTEGIIGTAMFSYIKGELPESQSVLIKNKNNWFMIVPFDKRIYIIKAGCELTNIELVALAKEVDSLIFKEKKIIKRNEILA